MHKITFEIYPSKSAFYYVTTGLAGSELYGDVFLMDILSISYYGNQYRYNQAMFLGMFSLIKLNRTDSATVKT